jgi:hypothetical protein
MTAEATVGKEKIENPESTVIVLEIIAIFFFILSLTASIVMLLLPVKEKVLPNGAFARDPESALWLLFWFSLAFTILLNALGAPKRRRRNYWKLYGGINVVLGFLCATEIFLLNAFGKTISPNLWWLLAVITVLGAIGVYLTERFNRLESAAAKRKAAEALVKAKRKTPKVYRFTVRRYFVSKNRMFVCKD